MQADGIIFDLDGTLWDSCRSVADSWRLSLNERYGGLIQPTEQDIRGIMGMTLEQIAQKLFSPYGARALEVCSDCIDHEYEYIAGHGGSLYPGVEALLNSLKPRHKLYIVSNCQCGYIECFTGFTGLGGCFDGYECSGSTGLSKGENIRLVVQRAGLSSPVYVGDTHMDELSAREAGLPFIHAAYGFGSAEKADAVLRCPLDLLDIIGD